MIDRGLLLECHSGDLQVLVSSKRLPWAIESSASIISRGPLCLPASQVSLSPLFKANKIAPHFVFQIHPSRCFLFSSAGRNLLVLFLLRLASREYEAAVSLLRSGSLIQHARSTQNSGEEVDDLIWDAIDRLTVQRDSMHPDGVGCRLKMLIAMTAFGKASIQRDETNSLSKLASELRNSVLKSAGINQKTTVGRLERLPQWNGIAIYETYVSQVDVMAECCRLTKREEIIVLDCLHKARVSVSNVVAFRRHLSLLSGGEQKTVQYFSKGFLPPLCPFDQISPETGSNLSLTSKLWDSIQSVQGFILSYRRPPTQLMGTQAIEFVIKLLNSRGASWAELLPGAKSSVSLNSELSLSRDWLLLYDLLTEGVGVSVQSEESSYYWGCLLCRYLARTDLNVQTKLAGVLKYLSVNKGFATGVAPKYNPSETVDGKEASDRTRRMNAVTSRLGVTLRSDTSFKLLFDKIDSDFSQLPPVQVNQQPPHPESHQNKKVVLNESDVLRGARWAVDILNDLDKSVSGRIRRCLTLDPSKEETARDFVQPLARYDVCKIRMKENDQTSNTSIIWNKMSHNDLLDHYREDVESYQQEQAKDSGEMKLLFLTEPIRSIIESPVKTIKVLKYIEGLRGLLAARFLSDGKAVDVLTRALLNRTCQSGMDLTRVQRSCGLMLSLSLEHLTELLLARDGSATLMRILEFEKVTDADSILDDLARLIFLIGRRCHLAQTLGTLSDIMTLLQESGTSSNENKVRLAARISFFVDTLIIALQHQVGFVHKCGSDPQCSCVEEPGVERLCYDAHMFVFEFANGLRLRPNQVSLINTICNSIDKNEPLCIQLMMGQGKTTVRETSSKSVF